ncbi:hypothetical protein MUDAN_BIHEEGNE_03308 [Lactiplantibacillus mudanjiangensis]|uniref:hypothetical protein n=1 Tax=Lactiplantibacillus mudanjiangensis TaxID=1296538 RepID=UPI00101412D4|nr:hypothetical protein MUDAN_BIHEEGNE_03308 [Lactiplantibacillus mudanjiangensis]
MEFIPENNFYEKKDIAKLTDWIVQAIDDDMKLYVKDSVFYSSTSLSADRPGKYYEKHRYTLIFTIVASDAENQALAEKYINKREKWYHDHKDSFLIVPAISAEMNNESKLSSNEIEKIKKRIYDYLKTNEVADIDKFDVDDIEHADIESEISHLGYIPQNKMVLTLRMSYVTI